MCGESGSCSAELGGGGGSAPAVGEGHVGYGTGKSGGGDEFDGVGGIWANVEEAGGEGGWRGVCSGLRCNASRTNDMLLTFAVELPASFVLLFAYLHPMLD